MADDERERFEAVAKAFLDAESYVPMRPNTEYVVKTFLAMFDAAMKAKEPAP